MLAAGRFEFGFRILIKYYTTAVKIICRNEEKM